MDEKTLERIARKLKSLEKYVDDLKPFSKMDLKEYKSSDSMTKAAIERRLQLVSDIQLDILSQVYKIVKPELVGTEEALISDLSKTLSERLLRAVDNRRKLRNQLVHAYSDSLYDEQVFEQMKNLGDVNEFTKEVKKFAQLG